MLKLNVIIRALGLLATGALLVLVFVIGLDGREDEAWFDANWEQTEDQDP